MAKVSQPDKGKRYDDDTRAEVVAFVKDYDKKNKRGGVTKASEKYKISKVTISKWVKAGKKRGPKPKSAAAKAAAPKAAKVAKVAKAAKTAKSNDVQSSLVRMAAIDREITALSAEYAALKASI